MSHDYVTEFRRRITALEEKLKRVEDQLNQEMGTTWGQEQTIRRQELLKERDILLEQLDALCAEAEDYEQSQQKESGMSVEVLWGNKKKVFKIVPSHLVAPTKGWISEQSQLAQLLASYEEGQNLMYETPNGAQSLKVLKKHQN
jgi:transcription elongation GreA/GreB family factor